MNSTLPWQLQYAQALGPTVVALIVGALATWIAYQQWATARNKLRYDLFDRRLEVYLAVHALVEKAKIHGQVVPADIEDFRKAVIGAEFLFKSDLREWAAGLHSVAIRAGAARISSNRSVDVSQRHKLIAEEDALLDYLRHQSTSVEKQFAKYLDLSKL
jgi:hypothetical protein